MNNPTLLLQLGDYMGVEKTACLFSSYPCIHCSYENLPQVPQSDIWGVVPVGTVEFVSRYCECLNIALPGQLSYLDTLAQFFDRAIRVGPFRDAQPGEFVKPYSKVKQFTGNIKSNLLNEGVSIDPHSVVQISEPVQFESEFRFYVHDFATGPKIQGWARYDDLMVNNPDPDTALVHQIAEILHGDLGPSAYSVDIGWVPSKGKYALVEVNDAWSLGYYSNTDPQSKPPTKQQYADMLVSRWTQILFCHLLDRPKNVNKQ